MLEDRIMTTLFPKVESNPTLELAVYLGQRPRLSCQRSSTPVIPPAAAGVDPAVNQDVDRGDGHAVHGPGV